MQYPSLPLRTPLVTQHSDSSQTGLEREPDGSFTYANDKAMMLCPSRRPWDVFETTLPEQNTPTVKPAGTTTTTKPNSMLV